MMHTYIQLPDGTQIGYGELLDNGLVKVAALRQLEGGFCVAVGQLPAFCWTEAAGYSAKELDDLASLIAGNAPLILRLAGEIAAARRADADAAQKPSQAQEPSGATASAVPTAEPDGGHAFSAATPAGCPASSVPQPTPTSGNQSAAPSASAACAADDPSSQPAATSAGRTAASEGFSAARSAQPAGASTFGPAAAQGPHAQGPHAQDYRQAASAVLDAASLVGRVVPATKVGRLVNTAMPAARTVVAAAPGIVEKAAPVVSQAAGAAAEAAPKVAEKAAKGIGRLGGKLARAASGAVEGVADAAKQAAENYRRESSR